VDAVRAIVALNESLKKPLVAKILVRNHIEYNEADLDKALASPVFKKGSTDLGGDSGGVNATAFTVANRLVAGRWDGDLADNAGGGSGPTAAEAGLQTMSGKTYEDYLERILIEAPGHI
jgi:hypothetical protein